MRDLRHAGLWVLELAGVLILCAVFLVAPLVKWQHIDELISSLTVSKLLPDYANRPISFLLIGIETAVGVGVLVPATRKVSLYVSAVLFSAFASYNIWRFLWRIPVPCGCFSTLFKFPPMGMLLIDIVLLALTAYLIGRRRLRQSFADVPVHVG
jgi:hypothetical protein